MDSETSQKNLNNRLRKIETLLAKLSSNGGKAKGTTIPVESIDNNSLMAKLELLESLISRGNTQPRTETTDCLKKIIKLTYSYQKSQQKNK